MSPLVKEMQTLLRHAAGAGCCPETIRLLEEAIAFQKLGEDIAYMTKTEGPGGQGRKARDFDFDARNRRIVDLHRINPTPNETQIRAVAVAMKEAGLYSPTTYIGDIERAIKKGLKLL